MGKYSCENCGKEFTQKSHYESHKRRKTPCESSVNKIAELEQQIQQLKTKMEYMENHIIQITGKTQELVQSKPDEPPVTQEVKPVKQVKKIT